MRPMQGASEPLTVFNDCVKRKQSVTLLLLHQLLSITTAKDVDHLRRNKNTAPSEILAAAGDLLEEQGLITDRLDRRLIYSTIADIESTAACTRQIDAAMSQLVTDQLSSTLINLSIFLINTAAVDGV